MASSVKLMSIYSAAPGLRRQVLRNSVIFQTYCSSPSRIRSAGHGPVLVTEVNGSRRLSTGRACFLKEITSTETDNKIVIEGKNVPSPREKYLAKLPSQPTGCAECPLCKLGLTVRHTDVLILSQFLNSKGKIIPREVTGLCTDQHKRISYLIVMAEKAGLIERDVERQVVFNGQVLYSPEEWENPNYHKYYEEPQIEEFLYGNRKRHV